MAETPDKIKYPPQFESYMMPPDEKLSQAFSCESIVDMMRKEEEFFEKLKSAERKEVLEEYNKVRLQSCILSELLWACVKKSGGKMRLHHDDLPPVDWKLEESYDMTTKEKVFTAIRA